MPPESVQVPCGPFGWCRTSNMLDGPPLFGPRTSGPRRCRLPSSCHSDRQEVIHRGAIEDGDGGTIDAADAVSGANAIHVAGDRRARVRRALDQFVIDAARVGERHAVMPKRLVLVAGMPRAFRRSTQKSAEPTGIESWMIFDWLVPRLP